MGSTTPTSTTSSSTTAPFQTNQAQNQTQNQTGQVASTTGPWEPAQNALKSILSYVGAGGVGPTMAQNAAYNNLSGQIGSLPNMGPQASGAINNAFNASTTPQQGMLSGALSGLSNNLGGYASGATNPYSGWMSNLTPYASGSAFNASNSPYANMTSNLTPWASGANNNPMSNPALASAMSTLNSDITNQVNSQFAAAGRDLSPANSTALARGLAQGEGGLLMNQYNQNVANQFGANNALMGQYNQNIANQMGANNQLAGMTGQNVSNQFGANNALFSGAGQTASGMTQQQLAALNAQLSGIQSAGALPGLYTTPGQMQMSLADKGFATPFQNLGILSSLVNPIASLGSTTSGNTAQNASGNTTGNASGFNTNVSNSTQSQPQSLMSNITSGLLGGAALNSLTGGAITSGLGTLGSTFMSALPLLMASDARVKDDIQPIGLLYDNTPVYSFRYKGDATPRVGLMAQDVEQTTPDAVHDIGGIKAVDYDRATYRARAIGGMLSELALAA